MYIGIEMAMNVGILAMEVYFPPQYVNQTELESFDKVSEGKYTIGLGQKNMGFCMDNEDVNSMCLTVLSNLMEKHHVSYSQIGRLDVGTESPTDKSKSIKSVLMQLFEDSGNFDVEGADNINACYGGTAALFNAVDWIESSAWDGRLALVVAGDNAVYESGPARPTGGAGAVAMLVGPNAPLLVDQGVRSSYMRHAYDFYKPNLASEYPVVDGRLSIQCYFSSLDATYQGYFKKLAKKQQGIPTSLNYFDSVIFHSPYCKLVQKSLARLAFIDLKEANGGTSSPQDMEAHREKELRDTYFDKDLEKASMKASSKSFEQKTKPSLLLASEVGNMYTPAVYAGLASLLISEDIEALPGKRIGVFSYGSGLTSTFFSISVARDRQESLRKLHQGLRSHVLANLGARSKISPDNFTKVLLAKQQNYNTAPFVPSASTSGLFPGTWYLTGIDDKRRRHYSQTKKSTQMES